MEYERTTTILRQSENWSLFLGMWRIGAVRGIPRRGRVLSVRYESRAAQESAPNPYFPRLFEPLQVAHVTLKNRILMGSMHTGLEEPGLFSNLDEMAEFYAERARGEAGIIVTGGISPNSAGVGFVGASKMSTQREVRGNLG